MKLTFYQQKNYKDLVFKIRAKDTYQNMQYHKIKIKDSESGNRVHVTRAIGSEYAFGLKRVRC